MKGFIISAVYLILSALIWYILYTILVPIMGNGDGLKAAIVFAWAISVAFAVMIMMYYVRSDKKLEEFFKKIS